MHVLEYIEGLQINASCAAGCSMVVGNIKLLTPHL